MSLTIGFIALFISVVMPGLIFQRFYYFGEFYKQFTTKVPPLRVFVYALIPGLIIQFSGIFLYQNWFHPSFKKDWILNVFQELFGEVQITNSKTHDFMDNHFGSFILYTLVVYISSIILGFVLSRSIRAFKWDIRWKLFRFKNEWSYIFSGEIFYFEKFKKSSLSLSTPNLKKVNVGMVYADVLISSSEGNQLYSGIVIDYDLKSDDSSSLDKIYLMNAKRYAKYNQDSTTNSIPKLHSKKIPGDLFVLSLENLININLSYITVPRLEKSSKPINGKPKTEFKPREVIPFALMFLVLSSFIPIFFVPEWLSFLHVEQLNFVERLIMLLTFNQFLWLFSPPVKKLKGKELFAFVKPKIIVFLILAVILIFIYLFTFN